ncbi:beta-1,3-glucan-binding protein [Plakobranchus ocellatus]|uniref:Beta-1,3-glucan-binding protein n=1 Tax=Plakobranchus ocellatus TaxID=259542 RepID=A0AAV4CG63_9GAST|nr:beta-1,3-glucan-binding protein [Plakobranchus ocellatus]
MHKFFFFIKNNDGDNNSDDGDDDDDDDDDDDENYDDDIWPCAFLSSYSASSSPSSLGHLDTDAADET